MNLFLYRLTKIFIGTKLIWITNYTKADKEKMYTHFRASISVMKPYLIKITNNSFMLLWTDIESGYVDYVMLDGKGNLIGNIQSIHVELSECTPVVSNERVVWYSYKTDRFFYKKRTYIEE